MRRFPFLSPSPSPPVSPPPTNSSPSISPSTKALLPDSDFLRKLNSKLERKEQKAAAKILKKYGGGRIENLAASVMDLLLDLRGGTNATKGETVRLVGLLCLHEISFPVFLEENLAKQLRETLVTMYLSSPDDALKTRGVIALGHIVQTMSSTFAENLHQNFADEILVAVVDCFSKASPLDRKAVAMVIATLAYKCDLFAMGFEHGYGMNLREMCVLCLETPTKSSPESKGLKNAIVFALLNISLNCASFATNLGNYELRDRIQSCLVHLLSRKNELERFRAAGLLGVLALCCDASFSECLNERYGEVVRDNFLSLLLRGDSNMHPNVFSAIANLSRWCPKFALSIASSQRFTTMILYAIHPSRNDRIRAPAALALANIVYHFPNVSTTTSASAESEKSAEPRNYLAEGILSAEVRKILTGLLDYYTATTPTAIATTPTTALNGGGEEGAGWKSSGFNSSKIVDGGSSSINSGSSNAYDNFGSSGGGNPAAAASENYHNYYNNNNNNNNNNNHNNDNSSSGSNNSNSNNYYSSSAVAPPGTPVAPMSIKSSNILVRSHAARAMAVLAVHSGVFATRIIDEYGVEVMDRLVNLLEFGGYEDPQRRNYSANNNIYRRSGLRSILVPSGQIAVLEIIDDIPKTDAAMAICNIASQSDSFAITLNDIYGRRVRNGLVNLLGSSDGEVRAYAACAISSMSKSCGSFTISLNREHGHAISARLEELSRVQDPFFSNVAATAQWYMQNPVDVVASPTPKLNQLQLDVEEETCSPYPVQIQGDPLAEDTPSSMW